MKNSKAMSSYNAASMFKHLVKVGDVESAKTAMDLCQILDISEITFYVGGQVGEGSQLYDDVKDFAKECDLDIHEKSFEEGVLYKLQLPTNK